LRNPEIKIKQKNETSQYFEKNNDARSVLKESIFLKPKVCLTQKKKMRKR